MKKKINKELHENIKKYYDSIAAGYNELYGDEQQKKYEIILNELLKFGFNEKSKLLDIGCGTCFSFNYFNCDVFGIEPSKKMIEQFPDFKYLLKKNKIIIEKAENLQNCFKEQKFDFILIITVAHHFKDVNKTLIKIKNKLKPKGIVVFSLLKGTEKKLEKRILKNFNLIKKIPHNNIIKDTILICSL